jgi:hypothetical protein
LPPLSLTTVPFPTQGESIRKFSAFAASMKTGRYSRLPLSAARCTDTKAQRQCVLEETGCSTGAE